MSPRYALTDTECIAVVVVIVAVVVITAAVVFGVVGYSLIRNWFSSEVRAVAVVDRKWQRCYDVGASAYWFLPLDLLALRAVLSSIGRRLRRAEPDLDDDISLAHWDDMFVSFETDRGPVELRVSAETYVELEKGDRGVLVYKGDRFLMFTKDAVQTSVQTAPRRPTMWR